MSIFSKAVLGLFSFLISVSVLANQPDFSQPESAYFYTSGKVRHIIALELGNLDGVEIDQQGNIYVSDWENGKLYKISSSNKTVIELGQYEQGLADLGLNSLTGELVLPIMLSSEVLFYTPSP